jgi:hypothetical protein
MYRRSSCKIESTKTKQAITNTIDGWKCLKKKKISKTKETAEWNCSVCKIDVHLYASIVCDECLEWNQLKCVGLKAPPKSTYWLCRQCYNKGK